MGIELQEPDEESARCMKNLFANVCLLLASCAVGLVLCEASLSLFYPKYQDVATARFYSDARRIWARTPHQRDFRHHPDTGAPHFVYYNNLALRQHRNFSAADLAAATNIGAFGDSFTENIRMAVPYSFTEPLDYLLNRGQQRFNVLNFGVEGYGTGQSLLHYEHFRHVADLDHVLYVYYENDLRNIYRTDLFHLDAAGQLVRNEAIREPWWTPLIRRLHLFYLVLDVRQRWPSVLADFAETTAINEHLKRGWEERFRDERHHALLGASRSGRLDQDDLKNSLGIFRQLIRRWKHLAEHNGSTFSVVLLPDRPPQPFVAELLTAEGVEVIDLHACFGEEDPDHYARGWQGSLYRFKHDLHWNEVGNRLAAVCLYRVLEERTGRPKWSEEKLQDALFQYYAAFEGRDPTETKAEGRRSGPSEEASSTIREKYLALEISSSLKDDLRQVVGQPDKRIIVSDFDVYLDRNQIIYVREECRPVHTQVRFFLHVIPVNERDIPEYRRQYGFANEDFLQQGLDIDGQCVVRKRLPAYPISRIRTGQFVKDAQRGYRTLWEGEFVMDPSAGEEKGGH